MRRDLPKEGAPTAGTTDAQVKRGDVTLAMIPLRRDYVKPVRVTGCDHCLDDCEHCRARPNPRQTFAGVAYEPGEANEYYDRLNN